MRIVFLTAELAPLAQSGGLGEAVRGLALELARRGHHVAVCLPGHRRALRSPALPPLDAGEPLVLALDGEELSGRWRRGSMDGGLELALFDLPELFDRDGLYGDEDGPWPDQALRFIAFSRACAELAARAAPDVVVAHDWHVALAPCLLRELHHVDGIASVQVVHNGAFQGLFPADAMRLTGLPAPLFAPEGLEHWGELSLLKAGITWADRIVAVSPRYAEELLLPDFGMGLERVYASLGGRLSGIANGIDVERYDPATDAALPARFDRDDPSGKKRCRAAVLDELSLDEPEPGRFAAAIGRLSHQKGWDVIADAADELVAKGATLALVGDGDEELAERLLALAERHPRRVHATTGWDEALSRRLYASADQVLIPSRFEPCGLVQLLAQRYGALPVAHAVGGLVDTIVDGENGILFRPLGAAELAAGVARGAELFAKRGPDELRRALLSIDVSWRQPAARWETLFEDAAREASTRL